MGLSCRSPDSWCRRFNVDNASLKSVLEKDSSVDPTLAKCTGDLPLHLGEVEWWKELLEDNEE